MALKYPLESANVFIVTLTAVAQISNLRYGHRRYADSCGGGTPNAALLAMLNKIIVTMRRF